MIDQIDINKLKGYVPDSILPQIGPVVFKFNITSILRLSHFLAQCAHESMGFGVTVENLNYSTKGLQKVFPKYFPGDLALSYAKKPEKIANRVYGDRMGNGDERSGDGYKYRGRGYIQLTGKDNYKAFDSIVSEDIINHPDLVATKYPLLSAAYFFDKNNLWEICDKGADSRTVAAVTRRVNGGINGLPERIRYFQKFYRILS